MRTKLFVAAVVAGIIFAAVPAGADHDQVYSPCDQATGYIHLSVEEVRERLDSLIRQGAVSPEHISVNEFGVVVYGTPHPLLIEAGVIQEWAIDHNGYARHYLDEYWEYRFNHLPNWTFWEVGCMSAAKEPLPHSPGSTTSTTTSSSPPSTSTTTTSTPPPTEPEPPKQDPIPAPEPQPPEVEYDDDDGNTTTSSPAYDLYDAEWDGWPFELTVRLLEERYVPNTPNRRHFSLSAAVDYLRSGGLVGGLDYIWESP